MVQYVTIKMYIYVNAHLYIVTSCQGDNIQQKDYHNSPEDILKIKF